MLGGCYGLQHGSPGLAQGTAWHQSCTIPSPHHPGITQGEITDFTASEHAENNPKSTVQPPGSICPLLELPVTPGFHPPPAQGSPAVGVLQMFPNKRGSEEKKKHPKATQGKAASFRSAGQRGGLWCTNSVSRYQ